MLAWPAAGRPSYETGSAPVSHPVLQDGPALGDERMQFGVLSEVSAEPCACLVLCRACALLCLQLFEQVLSCRGWTLVQKAYLLHRDMCPL